MWRLEVGEYGYQSYEPFTLTGEKYMQLDNYLSILKSSPEQIEFAQTMAVINANYNYTPVAFKNGDLLNQAGENEGSCKLFSFAKLHNLSESETLCCFGEYYRDVLGNPSGNDHQNIRNFISTGWQGVTFVDAALQNI